MSSADEKESKGEPKRAKRPTIYDVARMTGFSRGSVSRAFNNSPFINASTRERILEAAREIGYQPHSGSRLVKSSRIRRWGILLPNLSNPYYAKLFEAFDLEARCREAYLQLGLFHEDLQVVDVLVNLWSAGEVDGFVVDSSAGSAALLAKVVERGMPVLFLHGRPSSKFDWMWTDRTLSIKHALGTLQRFGHRKVAYVGVDWAGAERKSPWFQTWHEWFRENGGVDPEPYCCFVSKTGAGGMEAWSHFTAAGVRPTAVLAFNDNIACGIISAAKAEGLEVPRDLSVVGSDDLEEGRRIGLATMRPDLREAATLALKQLEMRRVSPNLPPATIRVESQFLMRDSIAPAPRVDVGS
jgi:DNA-binding LacI/PurR family transcriptional regulator